MKNQYIHESVFEFMEDSDSYTPKARLPNQEEWPRERGDLRGGNSVEVDASQAQADQLLTDLARFYLIREGGLDALDLQKSING
jgi:hypothetical protein